MCSVPCTPSKTDTVEPLWNELVLGANSVTCAFPDLIEDFWPKVVSFLSKIRNIDIAHPTDEAWFHIRRAYPRDGSKIDVLRLKRGFLPAEDVETTRLLAEGYSGITHANWQPVNFEKRHDNAFLSFLQKLSVLRGRDGVCYDRYLGKVTKCNYAECRYCQEAYRIMINPNSKWYASLSPWFDHMSSTDMDNYRTHEYAHWFGHILSGWGDDIE